MIRIRSKSMPKILSRHHSPKVLSLISFGHVPTGQKNSCCSMSSNPTASRWFLYVDAEVKSIPLDANASVTFFAHVSNALPSNDPSGLRNSKMRSCISMIPPAVSALKASLKTWSGLEKEQNNIRPWIKSNGCSKVHVSERSSTWNLQLGGTLRFISSFENNNQEQAHQCGCIGLNSTPKTSTSGCSSATAKVKRQTFGGE